MASPLISVVIATRIGRAEEAQRASAGYARETDCPLELLVHEGGNALQVWWRALVDCNGEYVHFSCDLLEPHPGWWLAGISAADAGFVAAPVLWLPDGERRDDGGGYRDWEARLNSPHPFCRRQDAPRALSGELEAVLRLEYAFTVWDGEAAIGEPG